MITHHQVIQRICFLCPQTNTHSHIHTAEGTGHDEGDSSVAINVKIFFFFLKKTLKQSTSNRISSAKM